MSSTKLCQGGGAAAEGDRGWEAENRGSRLIVNHHVSRSCGKPGDLRPGVTGTYDPAS
jgi:hypothetical protein